MKKTTYIQGGQREKDFFSKLFTKNFVDPKDIERAFLFFLTIISVLIRTTLSLRTWGLIHPDEIFQSLEMAHYLVFGYGRIPPEFQLSNEFFPSYAQSRSHLFPLIFVPFMLLGKIFGWNYWSVTIPLIRVFMGINAALITPATYKLVKTYTSKSKYAFCASVLVTFWWSIIRLGFRTLTNTFFIPWIFFIIAAYFNILNQYERKLKETEKNKEKLSFTANEIVKGSIDLINITFLTFLISLIIYIRLDLIIGIGAILFLRFPYKKIKVLVSHFIGFIGGISLGGLIDLIYYGEFLVSPINWFKFNIIESHSEMFGISPFHYYLYKLIYEPLFVRIIAIYGTALLIVLVTGTIQKVIETKQKKWGEEQFLGPFAIAAAIVIFIFSFPGHKEHRFVFIGEVFLHISCALALVITVEYVLEFLENELRRQKKAKGKKINRKQIKNIAYLSFLILFLGTYFLNSYYMYQNDDWLLYDDISRSLAYVGQQPDTKGVIILQMFWYTGGYTYLHNNISVLEIYNFDKNMRSYYKLNRSLSQEYMDYNYLIVPLYQIYRYPNISIIIDESQYKLVSNIQNKSHVYKYMNTTL